VSRAGSGLPYETRVLAVLLLLLLLVVVLGGTSLLLTRSARAEAEAAEREAILRAGDLALLRLGGEEVVEALRRPEIIPNRYPSSRLASWAGRHGLEGGALLSSEGTVLTGTPPLRLGEAHPSFGTLPEAERRVLSLGRPVIDPRGGSEIRWLYHPLSTPGGGIIGYVATAHWSASSPRLERIDRLFVWVQAGGLALAALLSLVFLRYVLRPYRLLASAAGSAPGAEGEPPPRDPDDLVEHFRGVARKLREQEEELARLQAGAGAGGAAEDDRIARGMSSAVLTLDAAGRVRTVNRAAEAALGLEAGASRGRPAGEVLTAVPGLAEIVADCLASGRGRSREVVPFRRPDGSEGHLGASLSPVLDESGRVEGAFCLLTDLTEIRSLQDRVQLRENLAALGELSAGVAHEFRNALATILGLARLVERRPEDAQGASNAAGGIVREVNEVRQVVDEFLLYARPLPLNRGPVDLDALLLEVAGGLDLDRERKGTLEVSLEGELPVVQGDESLLRQAFLNVLRNAREAGEGKEVRITVTGRRLGDRVELLFRDDGPGFPPESLETAFLPFATTKGKGTGLGLPIVQKTVVQHDGEISVSNPVGGGAEVRILLPLHD
jgi:PAS domain S-box-containing protein